MLGVRSETVIEEANYHISWVSASNSGVNRTSRRNQDGNIARNSQNRFHRREVFKLGLKVYVGVCQAEKEVIRYSRQRDKTVISNTILAT